MKKKLFPLLRFHFNIYLNIFFQVHGKRFVYKFVCDLKMLLGYSAGELNRLVTHCAERKLQRVRESLRPGVTKRLDHHKPTILTTTQVVQTME